jgi:cell division septation protein DedD
MKVICPKCQFENQADSSRVVCARCATIVEVRLDQGNNGFDSNGKRHTARLPFANGNSLSNSQPSNSQSFGQNKPADVYATRIGDEFDDVLDVPAQAQSNYSTTVEAVPMFEDVFSTQNPEPQSVYDFTSYEKTATTPIESFRTNTGRQRETQDYTEPSEQEFMGWPVLPENSADEDEVVGTGRGGLFLRVGIIVGVFGFLCVLAYYFLGDFIAKRKVQDVAVATSGGPAATTGASNPATSPVSTGAPAGAQPATQGAPVVTPKPTDQTASQSAKPKEETRQVVTVPPVEGRAGHSQSQPNPTPAPAARQEAPSSVPSSGGKGNWTIQVGSFKDQGEADARASRLNSAGGEARVVKAEIPGKGTWYRVQVGKSASREAAVAYGNQLKAKNLIADFIPTSIGK